MKKPEKKYIGEKELACISTAETIGYNRCWMEYEKFLPNKREIEEIIYVAVKNENDLFLNTTEICLEDVEKIVNAISKRIRE